MSGGGTGNLTPSSFQEVDAILKPEIEQTLPELLQSGFTLRDAAESWVSSYIGVPDMIKLLLTWLPNHSESRELLRLATEQALRTHHSEVVSKLDVMLAKSPQPHHLLSPVINSDWKRVLSTIAADHPQSNLRCQLDRDQRRSAVGLTPQTYQSPETLFTTIKHIIEDELLHKTPSEVTKESTDSFYHKIVVLAMEDEITFIVTLHILHFLATKATDNLLRVAANTATIHVCNEFATTLSRVHGQSLRATRYHALHLHLVASNIGELKLCDDALSAISTIVTPFKGASFSPADRRRIDNAVASAFAMYRRLLHVADGSDLANDEDQVIETVPDFLTSASARFSLVRLLSYREIYEDLVRATFTQACEVKPHIGATVTNSQSSNANAESRRRKCVYLLLAHAHIARTRSVSDLKQDLATTNGLRTLWGQVEQMEQVLREGAEACLKARLEIERGSLKRRSVESLKTCADNVVVAWGIVLWAEEGLTGGVANQDSGIDNDGNKGVSINAFKYAALLEVVAQRHKRFLKLAVTILKEAALRDARKGEPESAVRAQRRLLIQSLASWVKIAGHSVLLLFQSQWVPSKKVSDDEIRDFVLRVLQTVAPPFSSPFAGALMSLLRDDRISRAISEDAHLSSLALTVQSAVYDAFGEE